MGKWANPCRKGNKRPKKAKKREANIIQFSQAVTHPSTDWTQHCLTSVKIKDPKIIWQHFFLLFWFLNNQNNNQNKFWSVVFNNWNRMERTSGKSIIFMWTAFVRLAWQAMKISTKASLHKCHNNTLYKASLHKSHNDALYKASLHKSHNDALYKASLHNYHKKA